MFHLFKRQYRFFPTVSLQDILVLVGGISVFVTIAASTVTKFSIWFDEAFGSYLVRFDFLTLARYTSNDVHPPMYYWLLKIWTSVFGNTEIGLRSMSIFFGVITIIFVFMIALRLFGRRIAYLSLLFIILSPMLIRYSQEARMYTLLTADIMAATYMLMYATHTQKRWPWIVYGVLVAFGMLTQYFAALAWVAHWVWRYISVRSKRDSFKQTARKFFTKNWLIAHGVAAVLFLPWLPYMVVQFFMVQGHGFWIKPVTSATIPDFFTDVLLFQDNAGVQSWLAAGFYIVMATMVYLTYRLVGTLKGDDKKNYLLILSIIIVPLLVLFVFSLPPLKSAFVDRYLMEVVVLISVLFAINLVKGREFLGFRYRFFVGAVVVSMMMVGIVNQMTIGNYNRSSGQSNNVRQLLEKVREQSSPGTPVIADTPWIFYEAVVYDKQDSPIYFVDEITEYKYGSLTMLVENDDHKIRNLDAFDSQHTSFWVIGNLRDSAPRPLRANWQEDKSITINDDLTGQPLFKAVHFTVE